MMTMIKRLVIPVLFLLSLSGGILAQENDFGIWAAVSGTYRFDKHLEAKISASLRTINNTSKTDQYFAEIGLGYSLNDFVALEGSYRMINKWESDTAFHFRHKLFFGVKGTLPVGGFTISGRLLYQKTMKTYIEDGNDLIPDHYIRIKMKTSYSTPTSPFSPFVSVEPFIPVKNGSGFGIKKTRYSAGVDIKVSNHSSFEAGYLYESYKKTGVPHMHVLSIAYDLVF